MLVGVSRKLARKAVRFSGAINNAPMADQGNFENLKSYLYFGKLSESYFQLTVN